VFCVRILKFDCKVSACSYMYNPPTSFCLKSHATWLLLILGQNRPHLASCYRALDDIMDDIRHRIFSFVFLEIKIINYKKKVFSRASSNVVQFHHVMISHSLMQFLKRETENLLNIFIFVVRFSHDHNLHKTKSNRKKGIT
jgi:hypothetical protein